MSSRLPGLLPQLPHYLNRPRLNKDALEVTRMYKSLKPMVAFHGEGLTFCLTGTIPTLYNDTTYHIPIKIWLGKSFPRSYPEVFVTPTSIMFLAPNHKAVDRSGRVYHPYISAWNPETSTIAELVIQLGATFCRDPPVFDRNATNTANARNSARRPSSGHNASG
eukprot:RCo030377